MQFQAPRGTKDVMAPEVGLWLHVEGTFRDLCARYGYEEIRTPVFEETGLFARGVGETTDIVSKEMYTFKDRGDRSLTLRPEGTASVVRAYIQAKLGGQNQVHKFCYIVPIFRYERPQAGRLREAHQVGVEAIGSAGPQIDAEVICLNAAFYAELGIAGASLMLNSIGCPECRPAFRERLREVLAPAGLELCEDCRARLVTNPLRVLDCKVPSCKGLTAGAPSILDTLCEGCEVHFAELRRLLDALGQPYEVDPRLVRGLDYYARTAFEFKSGALGAQDSLSGGGRYDGLVELCGGKPTPGIGFAAGIERTVMVLESLGIAAPSDGRALVYVAALGDETRVEALRAAQELRRAGLCAEVDCFGRSLKAQLRAADALSARLTVIVGGDELARGAVVVRDLAAGAQQEVPRDDLANRIARLLTDHDAN
jgi:histidyl-tRNA synthetase